MIEEGRNKRPTNSFMTAAIRSGNGLKPRNNPPRRRRLGRVRVQRSPLPPMSQPKNRRLPGREWGILGGVLTRVVEAGGDSVDGGAQRIFQLRTLLSLLFTPQ